MHVGGTNEALGYAIFCTIKLAGYTLGARFIASIYDAKPSSAWVVGLTRTLLGMATGAIIYLCIKDTSAANPVLVLIPVRIAEWWIVIQFFYGRRNSMKNIWLIVFLAMIWSYILDIPAALGFLLEGGMGIC